MKYLNLTVSFLVLFIIIVTGDSVSAFCNTPSMYSDAPSPPSSYLRPSVPFCLSSYSYTRTHNCSSWEIDSYIDEVNEYIRKLNAFVDDVQSFANDAVDFANQAAVYAKCEADSVKSEIE